MKDGLKDILGKRIAGVIAAQHENEPRRQLFLIFSDGTSLELYGEYFNCGSGLDKWKGSESIRRSLRAGSKITDAYFIDPQPTALH